jgi:enamine deaminase RidA (YjgF/YER057c/UK114 family)/DNA-binding beta-propeller fold protein YncE
VLRFSPLVPLALLLAAPAPAADAPKVQRHLYVVCPGIRNYPEFGGAGILVFDIDAGHKFVRRIATPASEAPKPDNVKGVCACAATGRLYFTTRSKLYCVDLATGKTLWGKALPNGTDRMSITPDGKVLYVPSFEKDTWNVVDAATGDMIKEIVTKSGAHNTVVGLDGSRMYLGGLKSPMLFVADTKTHEVVKKVGPFGGSVRPFTVNASQTRAYVCVNDLLGFEIGDLTTGKLLHRVEVKGYQRGPIKRHGCPSHGVGLTPDEKEVWVVDAANQMVHVFDNVTHPPTQTESIKLREQPGWVTFSLDGKYAYLSTGEVIDTKTKKIVAALTDETGREVHSEKMVEVHFRDGKPVANGDQFGVGRVSRREEADRPTAKYLSHGVSGYQLAATAPLGPTVYTAQFFPVTKSGKVYGNSVQEQLYFLRLRLGDVLFVSGGDIGQVLHLNVTAATKEAAAEVQRLLPSEYGGSRSWAPPTTIRVGKLPRPDVLVAFDAVAVGVRGKAPTVKPVIDEDCGPVYGPHAAMLPDGPRVYISGQAEKGDTPAEAAAKTIASLQKTLDWLGCKPEDVAQAKCFLTPMSAAADVAKEFDTAFGERKVPLVFVEWESTLPIEIELIAKAPPGKAGAPAVEYLTPPWMKSSPVYAKVVRVNRGDLFYTAGLSAPKPGTAEEQVLGVFKELRGILDKTGGDFRHLAKATYYVSTEDASRKLNELRPKFYDPKRPPAASKAFVPGVGVEGRSVVIDMIAVRARD